MTTNLFDYFEEVSGDDGAHAPWAARAPRRANADFDVKLVPRAPDWRNDPESLDALERLQGQPWAGTLTRRDDGVELRLSDSWIETTGAALEAGGGDEAELVDLARGRRYAVQFWDANATKALHVGHLRNLAIGNALAASLEQAGGEVERRSIISDAGRSMGEAMAGIIRSGHHTQSWPEGDQKSDHFVGLCYADYVASGGFAEEGPEEREDSLTRELRMRNDAADELLKRVMSGEGEALELWFKTRAWVISGQRKTLARLGVAFDRVFFESDFLDDGLELTERGLREGKLTRREDGVVVFATGVEDLEEMPLLRADGQTTQHMRAVSYWMGAPGLEGVTTLQICGTEWVSHATCIRLLMEELSRSENGGASTGVVTLDPEGSAASAENEGNGSRNGAGSRGIHPTHDIFHGMVAQQKRAVSSSDEGGLLIDDLIEWIETQIAADPRMHEVRRAHPAPERIPAQVALGYFLPYPVTPRVDFDTGKLLLARESLGWDLVRARAHHGNRATSPGHRPADDPDYRSAVVQSEIYRRHLRLAVERYDVTPLALYLRHLARWYMEAERSSHVERVIHTLLDRSARGLGLEAGR
ncbi:MAG TPA: arginine--tRNA ligase [Solirubrobacteraceae bacterium]|jgi:arginyl-tRNA synthetase|nr:arginine--tRNA ligase [Solirubrobacteraceae bacterium]